METSPPEKWDPLSRNCLPQPLSWCQKKVISVDHTLWRSRKVTLSPKKAIVRTTQWPRATFQWAPSSSWSDSCVACGPFGDKGRASVLDSYTSHSSNCPSFLEVLRLPLCCEQQLFTEWDFLTLAVLTLSDDVHSCNYADQLVKIGSSYELFVRTGSTSLLFSFTSHWHIHRFMYIESFCNKWSYTIVIRTRLITIIRTIEL